jgi:hypothetical protein
LIDSEFKYSFSKKTPNKNGKSNRGCLDSDFDNTVDYWDYTSDVSFDWFDFWGLSFFSNEKRRHYRHLNESIFKPLSELKLYQQTDLRNIISNYFNYNVVLPTESSKIYQLSLKHMKEDEPQLPIEITNLKNLLAKHSTSVDNMEKKIKDVIKERLSSTYQSPLKIGNSSSYNFDYVYVFLKKVWESKNYELKEIDDHINRATPRIQNNIFHFENIPIGQGNEKEFEMMKIALYNILRNGDILKIFSDLKENKNNLDEIITKIRKMAAEIVDIIDNDLYETSIRGCCPSLLRFFGRH